MAVYDFKCGNCRKKFTLTMSITEYADRKRFRCPKCNSAKVERIFQPFFAQTSKKS
jgi:putative FmdB family regulatory protein